MTWSSTTIEPDEELAGDEMPTPKDIRLDERWLALVLLAKQTNAGTRAGYRRDVNTLCAGGTKPGRLA